MGEDLFEGTTASDLSESEIASILDESRDARVGADPADMGGCDGCRVGATNAFGKRVTGIVADGQVGAGDTTIKFAPVCDTRLECLFVPTGQAPNFMVKSLKYQDIEMIAEGQASVSGNGTAGDDGVPLTEFLGFGTCANLLRGVCVKAAIPLQIVLHNITNATAEVQIGAKGVKQ